MTLNRLLQTLTNKNLWRYTLSNNNKKQKLNHKSGQNMDSESDAVSYSIRNPVQKNYNSEKVVGGSERGLSHDHL